MRYYVSGFAGPKHRASFGSLVLGTWNDGEASKDAEVAALKTRMDRGEISKIEVRAGHQVIETITGEAPR